MATHVIPADPAININYVEEIKRSDFVEAGFMNGYIRQLLMNDQALLNKNNALSTSLDNKITALRQEINSTITTRIGAMQQEIEQNAVQECTETEINALFT